MDKSGAAVFVANGLTSLLAGSPTVVLMLALLPTHQVNALFMSPGGYRNADYIRAGGIMSLLFLALAVVTVWLVFV